MSQKLYTSLIILITLIALGLRLFNFTARAPFDWDQNRDYVKVKKIVEGKMTLIGPVARGEAGFYLGPLYYYLLVPGYILTAGDPRAFPLIAILFDVFTVLIIGLGLSKYLGRYVSLFISVMWASSWLAISWSSISWNVALLPLWTVVFTIFVIKFRLRESSVSVFLVGLLAGLSWHIHASLIPLSAILILVFCSRAFFKLKNLGFLILGYLLATSPLLAFDLRHNWYNVRSMLDMLATTNSSTFTSWWDIWQNVMMRLGKNTIGILTGRSDNHYLSGLILLIIAVFGAFHKRTVIRISAVTILAIISLTIFLRDPRVPEYYLAAAYIPSLVIGGFFLSRIPRIIPILPVIILTAVFSNLNIYSHATPSSFSLYNKILLVQKIAELGKPIDVFYELFPGREGGFVPLLSYYRVVTNQSAKDKVVITDKMEGPILIGGELATDVSKIGGLRAATRVVQ